MAKKYVNIIGMNDLKNLYIDGTSLKRYRVAKQLTQQEVAEAVGLKKATISNYECGEGSPSSHVLARLMLLYNVESPQSLVTVSNN